MAEERNSGNLVRKRKPNTDSYAETIKNIKTILFMGQNIQLKESTLSVMDDMISMTFHNIKKRALELTTLKQIKTVSVAAVKHAALLELPNDLVNDAFKLHNLTLLRKRLFEQNRDVDDEEIVLALKPLVDPLKKKYGKNAYFVDNKIYKGRLARFKKSKVKRSEVKGGIFFPVGRIQRHLDLNHDCNLSVGASFAIAALLEITTITILKSAVAKMPKGKVKISPRHVMLAIRQDTEDVMMPMFNNIIIEGGGEPIIRYEYLSAPSAPKKKRVKSKAVVAK